MSEAPKFMVHAPQAAPHPDTEAQVTHNHNDGSATINAGESTCAVTHGLPGTPLVRLNLPKGFDKFSYIVMTDKGFQVNLDGPVTEDVTFTWSADT